MRCRKCRKGLLTKNGIVRGRQRYRCRSCGFNFTQEHSNGWPPSSKLLIVVSYCCGETISNLAEQSGAAPASVFRWIEEARESIMGDREMHEWVIDALTEAVSFALTIEDKPKTEKEICVQFVEQISWLNSLLAQRRSTDGRFVPNFEALGWTDASRNPTDAEFSALVTKRVQEMVDKLRKSDYQSRDRLSAIGPERSEPL